METALGAREKILITPGPVHIDPRRWTRLEPMHHRSAPFRKIVRETEEMIGELAGSSSPVYLLTASGTGAMESAMANIAREGRRVLVVSGGKFGDRWGELASHYGCSTDIIRFDPGEAYDIDTILLRIEADGPEILALTHVESTSGLLLPLKDLLEKLPSKRPLVLLDAVASLGSEELLMDDWGVDLLVGAGQKALAAPPGVSFVIVGERTSMRGNAPYYFSFDRYEKGRGVGNTPFTPAVQSIQLLHQSLSVMRSIGFAEMRLRHEASSTAFIKAAAALSLSSFPRNPSSSVQALVPPEGVEAWAIIEQLLEKSGFIAAGGQDGLEGRIIRTGFLGLLGGETISRLVSALAAIMEGAGAAVDTEGAERAISAVCQQRDIRL